MGIEYFETKIISITYSVRNVAFFMGEGVFFENESVKPQYQELFRFLLILINFLFV